MSNAIDSVFPNFTILVLVIGPLIIVAFYVMTLAVVHFKIRFPPISAKREKFAKFLNLFIILYFIFPIWDMGSYLFGNRDTIFDRLFTVHAVWITFIILCVGIGQCICYSPMGVPKNE